jgi:23S rRNA (guanine2445-N2)-methyltransferase / 23S rRNA (guanine2069-N7)-methyltransferase
VNKTYRFIATAPRGSVDLLSEELLALGVESTRQRWGGMEFYGTLEMAYRVCLWSRLANRLFLPLAEFAAPTPEALYEGARQIDWSEHMDAESTLAVDCTSLRAKITHSHYASLKVKDAVVDQFRARANMRPSIDVEHPDLRISARLSEEQATISIDLSGESLHRRGYRDSGSRAPLKENLAAAILVRSGWPEVAAAGGGLLDPMCGSGTLPIEAGLMAADFAPGFTRPYFGFLGWKAHQPATWQDLLDEARQRRREGLKKMPEIVGCDIDEKIIRNARANAERAGLGQVIRFEARGVQYSRKLAGAPGLLVANPPYGERLGNEREIKELYASLGDVIKTRFAGWKAAVFTGRPDLGRFLGMRAVLTNKFNNGPIECRLLRFEVEERYFSQSAPTPAVPISSGAEMLANRLKKNRRTLGRWAKRSGIDCYRLYDADLPEYALAIDLYQGEEVWAHVQEYQAPASVEAARAQSRLEEALAALPQALDIPAEHVYFKVRQRQRGRAQYEKFSTTGVFHAVREGAARFLVNFTDYLDTGLFLDHRPTRLMLGEMAAGKRVLNLFAYTATATVHAALGGAASTTSIDMSNTYLDWARRNFELNAIGGGQHQLLQADCLEWLTQKHSERYDIIFLDPPTFSNSKRMEDHFDVQNDHVDLLRRTTELLADDGVLVFSNNFRRFRMDHDKLTGLVLEDITPKTIDKDFERRARIHSCWKITKAQPTD